MNVNGTFVGTGKWDGANQPPSAKANRTQPLAWHEEQQAGYQLGAKLNGSPVDPRDRVRLAAATATKHQTNLSMPHGRGNLQPDVQPSGGYNQIYTAAAYRLEPSTDKGKMAGIAMAFGAGNCDHNAAVSQRLHGERMGRNETVSRVGNSDMGHAWTETNARPRLSDTWNQLPPAHPGAPPRVQRAQPEKPPTIVIDPWAAGPAARKQDTDWASLEGTVTHSTFTQPQAQQAREDMLGHKADYSPGGSKWAESQKALRLAKAKPSGSRYGADNQVIDPKFADTARDKLSGMSRLNQDIMAVGAARESYNLNVGTAASMPTTEAVIDHGNYLDGQYRLPPEVPQNPLV